MPLSTQSSRPGGRALPHLLRWQRFLMVLFVLAFLLAPTLALAASPDNDTIYVVKRGDTLTKIAARYGSSVTRLMQANGLRNQNFIYVGQRLRIPGGSSTGGTTSGGTSTSGGKWIDINLSSQRLTAYEGNKAVLSVAMSSGTRAHPTVVGRYTIRTKLASQAMSGPGYYLPGVPWVMYFYGGYAIHGTYWHNNFGTPMSHGCVNLSIANAAWVYRWASIGTSVVTHY